MTSFAIEVKNRETVNALQKAIDFMPQRVDQAVKRAAIETGGKMAKQAPFDKTELVASIKADPIKLMEWRVGPHVNYAEHVEKGTQGGGNVPWQEILAWVKRRGITPRNPEWDIKDLAWAIQKKILMRGSKAQPFVKPVADSGFVQTRLNQLVAQQASKALAEAGL